MKALEAQMDIQHQELASTQSKLDQKSQEVFEYIRSVKMSVSCEEVNSVIAMLCLQACLFYHVKTPNSLEVTNYPYYFDLKWKSSGK